MHLDTDKTKRKQEVETTNNRVSFTTLFARKKKRYAISYYDSDHSPIYAEIEYKNNHKLSGPGFWKFYNSLLDNEELLTHLKFFLIHTKEKHCDTKDKRLYWEMIKMEIRDFCIRFSKQLSKRNRPALQVKTNKYEF